MTNDAVNHPSHYCVDGYECFDVMLSVFGVESVRQFCICNAFKYLFRHKRKNGEEDLKKANWYMQKYHELGGKDDKTD